MYLLFKELREFSAFICSEHGSWGGELLKFPVELEFPGRVRYLPTKLSYPSLPVRVLTQPTVLGVPRYICHSSTTSPHAGPNYLGSTR